MPFQVKLVSAGLGAGAGAEALGACACARAAAAARLTMSPHAPPTRVRPRARRPGDSFLLQDAFACFTVRSSLDSRVEEINSCRTLQGTARWPIGFPRERRVIVLELSTEPNTRAGEVFHAHRAHGSPAVA